MTKLSKKEFIAKFLKERAKKKKRTEIQYTSYYCDLRAKINRRIK
jgi:hypothetical protein